MPVLRPCKHGKLSASGRCPKCRRDGNARQYASRRRRGLKYGGQRIPATLRSQVLERDAYVCRYCGAKATAVDHVVPQARGGEAVAGNLVASCVRCNAWKGAS